MSNKASSVGEDATESYTQEHVSATPSADVVQKQEQTPQKPPGYVSDAIIASKINEASAEIAEMDRPEIAAEQDLRVKIAAFKRHLDRVSSAPKRKVQMTCESELQQAYECINWGKDPSVCEDLIDKYQNCTFESKSSNVRYAFPLRFSSPVSYVQLFGGFFSSHQ